MEAIEIRRRVILDAMLDELHLPKSTSETVVHPDGTVSVTLLFYPSARHIQQSSELYSCTRYAQITERIAEDEAAYEAIQYMECVFQKTPKDYSYARLQKKQSSVTSLSHQVTKKEEEIRNLTKACDTFVRRVHGPSDKIQEILKKNVRSPETNKDCKMSLMFPELEKAAYDLNQITLQLAELIQPAYVHRYEEKPNFNTEEQHTDYHASGLGNYGDHWYNDEIIYNTDERFLYVVSISSTRVILHHAIWFSHRLSSVYF